MAPTVVMIDGSILLKRICVERRIGKSSVWTVAQLALVSSTDTRQTKTRQTKTMDGEGVLALV